MRSKGKAVGHDSPTMADKKGGKKGKFRFRGGGNKKENGMVPGLTNQEAVVSPEDDVAAEEVPLMGAPSGSHDGYTLRNSDIINGEVRPGKSAGSHGNSSGSPRHGNGMLNHVDSQVMANAHGDHMICTCPAPPEASMTPHSPSQVPPPGRYGDPGYYKSSPNGNHGNKIEDGVNKNMNGNHGNKVSVVAVIEGGASPTGEQGVGTVSSNDSSSSTSVCSVRPKVQTPVPNSTERTLSDIMGASPQGLLVSHDRHGNRSPSSQSLVSVASSTVAMDMPADSPLGGRLGSERSKQTLGDIIQQIDAKSKDLLVMEDFTVSDPYPDLQFLAHQSRYNSDIHIKRRLIAKLVDSKVVDIFLRVFQSVHSVDYMGEEPLEQGRSRSKSASEASHEDVLDSRSPISAINGASSAVTESSPDVVDSAAAPPDSSRHSPEQGGADSKSLGAEECDGGSTSAIATPKNGAAVTLIPPALKNLRAAITLMWNTTDKSPVLCEECVKRGLIQILLDDLKDPRLTTSEIKDQQRLYLVKGYLGILNNIVCFFNDTRELFRDAGAIKILQPYLKSQLLLVKTKTIMLLSYIINESENDVINASDKNIGFTIKMLEATLEKENHYSRKFGFWAVEVAAGLNRLGGFETNKERIVQKGILPLYLQLMTKPCSEDEQLIATQGIWILAYCERARNLICDDSQVITVLRGLVDSSSREEIKLAAGGALWILDGRGSGVGAVPKSPKLPSGAGHIYISYHWTCKQFVIRLREKLRSFGYKVFVDVENMGTCGLPLKTIFDALEKTCVVLMCMTQKYKDSPCSRNEIEHAVRLRRDIIPLRRQQNYNPDGWLGASISSKLIFDFSREEHLENVTAALVRELGPRGRSKSSLAAAAAAASVVLTEREASRSPSVQSVASGATAGSQNVTLPTDITSTKLFHWTESDVSHWLMDNGLTSAIDRFQSINGELLYEMRKMHQMAPESFFLMLRTELAFDWITQLKFTKALDKL